jgi:NADH:ubiquinone oxidoreductase subunit E
MAMKAKTKKGKAKTPARKPAKAAPGCACCGEAVDEKVLYRRLDKVIAEYRDRPGALIPILQIAQSIFGFLPKPVIKRISEALKKPYSEVAGVVGFYSFFSTNKKGKHTVRVCLGTACYVRGGKRVLEALQKELKVDVGQTTADGMFTLEVARCFGACGLAPTICVDSDVHKRVRPAKISEVLAPYYQAPAKN